MIMYERIKVVRTAGATVLELEDGTKLAWAGVPFAVDKAINMTDPVSGDPVFTVHGSMTLRVLPPFPTEAPKPAPKKKKRKR